MAAPQFNSVPLTTEAEQLRTRGPTSRHMLDHLPGVNGAYAQTHGHGEQLFEITGIRETSMAFTGTELALYHLRNDVRTIRLAQMSTVATFRDPTTQNWTNCMLVEYSVGPPYYFREDPPKSGDYYCGGRVHIVIISLEGEP